VSDVSVVSGTQITATFTIASNAPLGAAGVSVTTYSGTTGSATFTVSPAPLPTLLSVSPSSGVQGANVPVTLTGTNFIACAAVSTSNPGITVVDASVVSGTQITATLAIASNAATGTAVVTVTTSGGTTGPASFVVNPPPPTLVSVNPSS